MVDRLTIKERLRASVASRDASRVAAVFELPPISPVKSEAPKRQHHENLQDGSVDWSVVLSSLLDAHEAAEAVSYLFHLIAEKKHTHVHVRLIGC